MRTRENGARAGGLTENLVACVYEGGGEKKKGRESASQPGDGEHEGQETTSRGWWGLYVGLRRMLAGQCTRGQGAVLLCARGRSLLCPCSLAAAVWREAGNGGRGEQRERKERDGWSRHHCDVDDSEQLLRARVYLFPFPPRPRAPWASVAVPRTCPSASLVHRCTLIRLARCASLPAVAALRAPARPPSHDADSRSSSASWLNCWRSAPPPTQTSVHLSSCACAATYS